MNEYIEPLLKEPENEALYAVIADQLEERGDPRSAYLRLVYPFAHQLVLTTKPSDDLQKIAGVPFDQKLSRICRKNPIWSRWWPLASSIRLFGHLMMTGRLWLTFFTIISTPKSPIVGWPLDEFSRSQSK